MTEPASSSNLSTEGFSPLTILQKLINGWTGYVVAVGALIGEIVLLKTKIRDLSWSDWPIYAVAFGPPCVFLLWKYIPRLVEKGRQQRLIKYSREESREKGLADASVNYFLIGPYSIGRRDRYKRADGLHKTVVDWIKTSNEPILIITGFSGTGKTSLLQAYVAPELTNDKPPYYVIIVRSFGDPLNELRKKLLRFGDSQKESSTSLASTNLFDLIKLTVRHLDEEVSGTKLLLIFDQLEEIIVLHDHFDHRRSSMQEFLQKFRTDPIKCVTLLLSIRSDYKVFLDQLGVPPLDQKDNWVEVPAFTYADSENFLTAPETELQIAPERLRNVLTEASKVDGTQGLIRPIILNMLGVVLRRIANSPVASQRTRSLLTDDLRQSLNETHLRMVAPTILPHLLTDADTKRPRTVDDLHIATGLDLHLINGCLLDLSSKGYCRLLNSPPEIGERVWEISHDFVARLLGPILKTPIQNIWNKIGAVLYLLSLVLPLFTVLAVLVCAPWYERVKAETILRDRYQFMLHKLNDGYSATEVTDEDADLSAAFALLAELNPVTVLNLSSSNQLKHLHGIEKLPNITKLDLGSCFSLTDLVGLDKLVDLQTLDLRSCLALTNIRGLTGSRGPQSIVLESCYKLESLDGCQTSNRTQSLDLTSCTHLHDISAIKNLQGLQVLNLSGCEQLSEDEILQNVPAVQSLIMMNLNQLSSAICLQTLRNLEELDLSHCDHLINLNGLQNAKWLQRLKLYDCSRLTDLNSIDRLSELRSLALNGCVLLMNTDALYDLKSLESLDLGGCAKLVSIDALEKIESLRTLDVSGCNNLSSIKALEKLTSLEKLNLSGLSFVTSILPFQHLTTLTELRLSHCSNLHDLTGMTSFKVLKSLNIEGCSSIITCAGLDDLPNLQTVNLAKCTSLTSLSGISHLPKLQTVDLNECKNLSDISDIVNMSDLTEIRLFGCEKLGSIAALDECHLLKSVDLRQIKNLNLAEVKRLRAILPHATISISEEFYDGKTQ